MFVSVQLKNFFSFGDCKISLNPDINLLIGINGSGKSNFLKAIKLVKEGVSGIGFKEIIGSKFGGVESIFYYGQNSVSSAEIIYELDAKILSTYGFRFLSNVFYKLELKRVHSSANYFLKETIYQAPRDGEAKPFIFLQFDNGTGYVSEKKTGKGKTALTKYTGLDGQETALKEISDPDRFLPIYAIKKAFNDIACYELFDTRLESRLRKPIIGTSAQRLSAEGENLPQILNTIKINDKDEYKSIVNILHRMNPYYSNIDFNQIGGNIELMLEESRLKKSIHAAHISDGTLQFLCLLAILKNKAAGGVITIDEPEVRLHPNMIDVIAEILLTSSKERQLIVSTHSETLLNSFNHNHVLLFDKDATNTTQVRQMTKEEFAKIYGYVTPSQP